MVEKKIYCGWAYSENECEKRKMNMEIYSELTSKYKCFYSVNPTQEELDRNDFVYGISSYGYAKTEYVVYKKPESLSEDEILLIIDQGNLCFGGAEKKYENIYKIYTD